MKKPEIRRSGRSEPGRVSGFGDWIRENPALILILILLLFLGAATLIAAYPNHEKHVQAIDARSSDIRIAFAELDIAQPTFFTYRGHAGAVPITFFASRSTHGTASAFLDACRTCFQYHEGYLSSGSHLICNHCGLKIPFERTTGVTDECDPVPLKAFARSQQLIIQISDLRESSRYFDVSTNK